MKLRILEESINGKKSYIIQQKFLFWWFDKRFVEVGTSGCRQYTDVSYFSWNSLEEAKYIKENYRAHEYKGYTIYPCITTNGLDMNNSYVYVVQFYIEGKGYIKDKILGSLDELKIIIDRRTHKDVITTRVVED